jgi:uncharacterized protein (DUF427 family)
MEIFCIYDEIINSHYARKVLSMTQIIKVKNAEGTILASSDKASHPVYEIEGHWYFHPEQVAMSRLEKTQRTWKCSYKGIAIWYNLNLSDKQFQNVAWEYTNPPQDYRHIEGYIGFWGAETKISVAER